MNDTYDLADLDRLSELDESVYSRAEKQRADDAVLDAYESMAADLRAMREALEAITKNHPLDRARSAIGVARRTLAGLNWKEMP